MISGRTEIIAHLGYPTESLTAPMIDGPNFGRGLEPNITGTYLNPACRFAEPSMPEIPAASPDPACFCLHFGGGIEENQSLAPDLFSSRAPAPGGAHTRDDRRAREADGRFAKGHSGNPRGRPRGIPNPKRRVITLRAWRENREAVLAVTRRQPWLFRSLVRQVLPPARPIDPAERIGLRIASVRTPEQVWRALDKALQAASRGEIAPAEAARIMRRIEARLRAERRRKAGTPAASRHAGQVDQGRVDQGQVDRGLRPAVRGEPR
jgi:hypothetical protein